MSTTNKPTDAAGEAFNAALEEAKLLAVSRFHEDHDDGDTAIYAMLPAIRTAADALAAERVKIELRKLKNTVYPLNIPMLSRMRSEY